MCWQCDSDYAKITEHYDGHDLCDKGYINRYKAEVLQEKRNRVEKIDQQIEALQEEKRRLMQELGVKETPKYPWTKEKSTGEIGNGY